MHRKAYWRNKHLLLHCTEEYSCNDDLLKRVQNVDVLQCLGIERHFQHEINVALEYLYRLSIYVCIICINNLIYFLYKLMQRLIVRINEFIKVKTSLTDNEHILERKKHQSGIKKFPHQRSERYGFGISRSPTPSI